MNRIVKTENGYVRGAAAAYTTVTVFKAIPFAAPPVGDNRWRVPQPAESWDGVRDCLAFAPAAMQQRPHVDFENMWIREFYIDPDIEMSEDCLYLNIWTPSLNFDEKLPVVIWYHGGGMQGGYTSEMEFNGEYMARRGVVFVSIAYRVGVFGYLAHPQLTQEGYASKTGYANFGLHDQRAGLAWVQRNISNFGGDPENITLMGQSAGGRSVLFQAMTPYNHAGDFQRVISQSGGGIPYLGYSYPSLAQAEQEGVRFLSSLGISKINQARQLDAEVLRQAGVSYQGARWGVCVDDDFLPEHPLALLSRGEFLHVPMLCGYTAQDMSDPPDFDTVQELQEYLHLHFPQHAEEILTLCRQEGGDVESMRRACYINGQRFGAELLAKRLYDLGLPVYLYCFDSDIPGDNHGAFHSSELWFVFETLQLCWRPFKGRHYDLARQICNYWTNFIKFGNPNGKDQDGTSMPEWKTYTQDFPFAMRLSDIPHMETEMQTQAVCAMLAEAASTLWKN